MSAKAEKPEENLDEELIVDLRRPIDGPDGPVSRLVVREPTAGEIMMWDSLSGVAADIMAISVVTGVPKSVVEKLPARDFHRAARRIGAFLS